MALESASRRLGMLFLAISVKEHHLHITLLHEGGMGSQNADNISMDKEGCCVTAKALKLA